jgi:hypothetical protein
MATPARELAPFPIPERAPAQVDPGDGLATRLMLAERIAELENIKTIEEAGRTLPRTVGVYVQAPVVSLRRQRPVALLCTISHDVIVVCGLDAVCRNRIIERGWGENSGDGVRLLMPQDLDELNLCWKIVQHAHKRLIDATTAAAPKRVNGWPDNLPRFSRTTLQ